ncbi:Dyp-type peroxidase domain-containing protein [Acidaminococcus massiliensis]|uniref:Dyp-type peroxidase domain-containing protein n=1 Tax=Acidaminococcus massiliensis TaxID=1852375 RepID=UPI0036F426A9
MGGYLFPTAKKTKKLENFKGMNGEHHTAPVTPVDFFLHVRAVRRQRAILLSIRSWASFVPLGT